MIKKNIRLSMLVGVIAIGAMVAIFFLGQSKSPVNATNTLDENQAIEKAKGLLGEPASELKVIGKSKVAGSNCMEIANIKGDKLAEVEEGTGKILSARLGDIAEEGSKNLNKDEAKQLADDFIKSQGVDLAGYVLAKDELANPDSPMKGNYIYTWSKEENGVKLPKNIEILVNKSTGRLVSFNIIDEPVTVSLVPKISKDDAIKKASTKMNFKLSKAPTAELSVWPYNGVQRLRWVIDFRGATPTDQPDVFISKSGQVIIDALTGEIIEEGSW